VIISISTHDKEGICAESADPVIFYQPKVSAMLNTCSACFPSEEARVFLAHCAVSPLFKGAAAATSEFANELAKDGIGAIPGFVEVLPRFHKSGAELLHTFPENIAFVHSTAEALNMLANGYPFKPGDQVISYVHEYPSNHYPWVLQEKRGVELILLKDTGSINQPELFRGPQGWSMQELEQLVTKRTKIIALSHVQFASGYAADLQQLGNFCHRHGIDLVVDCAQSLGCLPVLPEEYHISALASSGWKWLLGPLGAGIFYTSEKFRGKLQPTMAGTGLMRQGRDYLNHSWNPYQDARMFEYSTLAWDHVAALEIVISEIFLKNRMEDVRDEVFRLQDVFLAYLDHDLCTPLLFPAEHRSGIIGMVPRSNLQMVMETLKKQGVVMTGPAGYLRLAPHFYLTDKQMIRAAQIVNSVCAEQSGH
jgi:cysteine desulfurase / selenocysteine lyase